MRVLHSNNTAAWEEICTRFKPLGLDDIYFHLDYITLYPSIVDQVFGFVYEQDEETFFLPYIRQPLLGGDQEGYDFESAYGYNGPLSTTTESAFLTSAWNAFYNHAREQKMIAGFLRCHPLLKNYTFALNIPFIETAFMRPTVFLTLNRSEEEVITQYESSTRTKIKKAQRNGITVEKTQGIDALLEFANLYRITMQVADADNFYFFSDRYFRRIAMRLPGHYEVFRALHEGYYIGGVLTLNWGDFVHLHLSATDFEMRNLGVANLLRHTAIVAHLNRERFFHFGGGLTNDPNDSLLRFKHGFSRETAEYWVLKVIIDEERYQEVIRRWEMKNPEKTETLNQIFLRYRF